VLFGQTCNTVLTSDSMAPLVMMGMQIALINLDELE